MTSTETATPPEGGKKSRLTFVLPSIVLLVVLGVVGVGGYVGSSQAIGEKPAWRKLVRDPAQYQLTSEVVAFLSTDSIPLRAWWLPAEAETRVAAGRRLDATPRVTVIVAHGQDMNRSGMLPRAAFLVRHGYNVLDLDLRDHGESGGHYITPGYREAFDVLGGVAYVRGRGERGPIVVLGYSYGAVAALHATAQCADIAAAIADSPFIAPDSVLKNVANAPGIPLAAKLAIWFARLRCSIARWTSSFGCGPGSRSIATRRAASWLRDGSATGRSSSSRASGIGSLRPRRPAGCMRRPRPDRRTSC